MKFYIYFGILSLFLLNACGKNEAQRVTPTEAEKAEIIPIGEKAAGILLKTLQGELMAAVEAEGVMGAITICNQRAHKLTDSLTTNLTRVKDIKRTSSKYRNPKNRPDSYEQEALKYYSSNPEHLNEVYVQKIITGSETHFRYYKPLTIKPVCTFCHGPVENLSPDLIKKVKEYYPGDKAVGYNPGDFRGVVRVSVQ